MKLYRVIGKETSRIYAEGTREECFRYLHKEYPSFLDADSHGIGTPIAAVYPETLLVNKIK